MKRIIGITLLLCGAAAVLPASGGERLLPERIGYTIYMEGVRLGHCDIRVTESADELLFESTTKLERAGFKFELMSKTYADPKTFLVRRFDFTGTKDGRPTKGSASADGAFLSGSVFNGDQEFPYEQKAPHDEVLFLEDYVMEHEILIALTQSTKTGITQYSILFPASFSVVDVLVGYTSEVAIESEFKETVCMKMEVSITGSSPFASFFDPERRLPVYLAWPQTNVEAFLDEFFGDEPVTRYRARQN